jgi:hypothetical protein
MPDVPDNESPMVTPVVGLLIPTAAGGVIGAPPNSAMVGVLSPEGKEAKGPGLGDALTWWSLLLLLLFMTAAAGPVCTPSMLGGLVAVVVAVVCCGGSCDCDCGWSCSNGLDTGAALGVAWSAGADGNGALAEDVGVGGQNCYEARGCSRVEW